MKELRQGEVKSCYKTLKQGLRVRNEVFSKLAKLLQDFQAHKKICNGQLEETMAQY